MSSKILVTDGRSLAALAVIRSLGLKGNEIHCGESFRHNLSSYSRYVDERVTYPDPGETPDRFVDFLHRVCQQENYDLVIPVRDETTVQLSKHRDEFAEVTNVLLAAFETLSPLMDKGETVKIAQQAGVPVPKTWFPEETNVTQIKDEIAYPVLIRPRRSSGARGIEYVESDREFSRRYAQVEREYGRPIVQEYIDHSGGHYSIGTVFDTDSNEVATHVYREVKQYPASGGPAVTAISVPPPAWTREMLKIFEFVGWVGPAHMDVLYDPVSKEPKLLEVNPRLWMSLQISISSNVDFPELIRKLGLGLELEADTGEEYTTTSVYRWVLPNEILWLLTADDKIQGVREFVAFDREQQCFGTLSVTDPVPTVGTVIQSIQFLSDHEKRDKIFNRGW